MAAWPFILVLHRYLQWEAWAKASAWRGAGRGRARLEAVAVGTHREPTEGGQGGSLGPCRDSQVRAGSPQPLVSVLLPR